MPDLQNLVITPLGAANVNTPRFMVSFRITDSTTGAVLFDFTGANALSFPAMLGALTVVQRQMWFEESLVRLIRLRAGID